METKIKGIEAVSAGLAMSGVTRIEIAPGEWKERILEAVEKEKLKEAVIECPAVTEEAIGRSCFFSENGEKAACVIMEDRLYRVLPVLENRRVTDAAFIIIVFGEERYDYIRLICLYGVVCWMAYDPAAIIGTIQDAARYSELKHIPVLLYIPVRVLISSRWTDLKRTVLGKEQTAHSDKSEERAAEIKKKYITPTVKLKYVIAATGDIADLVEEKVKNHKEVAVVKLDMICSHNNNQLPFLCDKILLIEKNRTLFQQMAENKMCKKVILDNDFFKLESQTENAVRDFLNGCPSASVHIDGDYQYDEGDDILKVRRPDTEYRDDTMCPGCRIRTTVKKHLDTIGCSSYSEDFFCEYRMSTVRTGIRHDGSEYRDDVMTAEVIFTNRRNEVYPENRRVVFVEDECRRDGNIFSKGKKKSCSIIDRICSGCGKCLNDSGCPSIWKRGLKMFIDSARCAGCGLCIDICERGAIEYEC